MLENKKISNFINSTVGVGILSWKSHETLEKSLQSYEKVGFKDFFDEIKILFQEICDKDRDLAKKYGYEYVGVEKNMGIQGGHRLICKNLTSDYVLVLENDNPIVEPQEVIQERLLKSLQLLENGTLDMVRLRHRWHFGEGFSLDKYLNFFKVQEFHEKYNYTKIKTNPLLELLKSIKIVLRPDKAKRLAGYSLYCEKNPEKIFSHYITKLDDDFFSVSSSILAWTNQSVLLKRELYKKLLDFADKHPSSRDANGFQDLEKPLNCKWWREQNFKIGVCEGLFSHNRFDDSWRENHHAYNKQI